MTEATLLTDGQGRTWHALERDGGSISLYYTREGVSAHFVVWDSLDGVSNSGDAKDEIARLKRKIESLSTKLDAAYSILWMAEKYAEGGGSHGPEMRDYTEAMSIISTLGKE